MKIVIDPGAFLPERAHDLDAGYDLRSPIRAYVPPYSSAIFTPALEIVSHLDSTERGDGGFGSTGR